MNDTSPEIAAVVHARMMAKTGEERFLMGIRMHESACRIVMASFPQRISEGQRRKLLFERFYGGELSCDLAIQSGKGNDAKDPVSLFANDSVASFFQQALVQR